MPEIPSPEIFELEKAEHSLKIRLNGVFNTEILDHCIHAVEKGVAVDLLICHETKFTIENDAFLLNKSIQLIKKGGCIYTTETNSEPKYWMYISDFNKTHPSNSPNGQTASEKQVAIIEFEKIKQSYSPYLIEKGDIQIRFSVSDTLILNGDTIELNWEVDGAETVIIQGLGEVDSYGKKKIYLDKNTIIKIGASNKHQSQIKALWVEVADADLDVEYDIGFIHPKNEVYTSLVKPDNHPHVYGVAKGNKVKINWSVPHATAVHIHPFDIKESTGSHTFYPTESMDIEIQAEIKNRVFRRKIQVLLFPIPVFTEKKISLQGFNETVFKIKIPEFPFQTAQQFLDTEKKKYQALVEKIDIRKQEIGQKINKNNINDSFFTQLKNRYFNKKNILNELSALQSNYEQAQSGNKSTNV
jgi:hypothetical protein